MDPIATYPDPSDTVSSFATSLKDENIPDDREPLAIHIVLLVAISGVILSNITLAQLHKYQQRWIPPAAVSVICGLAVGALIRIRYTVFGTGNVPYELGFDGPIFFLLLLPIINFDSGISLRRKPFFDQFFSILSLSVIGTLSAALLIGIFIHLSGAAGITIPLTFEESMALAAILAATDGLTVGGILDDLDAPPKLVALVLGEGSMNDAVSIVLYNTFAAFMDRSKAGDSNAQPQETASETLSRFFSVLIGSVSIGIGLAIVATYVYRYIYRGWRPIRLYSCLQVCCSPCFRNYHRTALIAAIPIGRTTNHYSKQIASEEQALLASRRINTLQSKNEKDKSTSTTILASSSSSSSAYQRITTTPQTVPPSSLTKSSPIPIDTVFQNETLLGTPIFLILVGYTSYMAAESLALSGVVAVLFAGIGLNYFTLPIVGKSARQFTLNTSRSISMTADTAVFFQVGLDIALTIGTNYGIDNHQDIATLGIAILTVLFSRAVAIFPLTLIINYLRRDAIPVGFQIQLWHAGLRGAGTYAFALVWPSANRELVVDITAGVVLFTVLFLGITTVPVMRLTGSINYKDASPLNLQSTPVTDTATVENGPVTKDNENTTTMQGSNYIVKIVHEARVYIPKDRSATPSMRAVNFLTNVGNSTRWWISGIRPVTSGSYSSGSASTIETSLNDDEENEEEFEYYDNAEQE